MARQYMNIKASTGGTTPPVQAPIPNHILGVFMNDELLYTSTDLGQTWTKGTASTTTNVVTTAHWLDANTLFMGNRGGSIFKTISKGNSWTSNKPTTSSYDVNNISIFNQTILGCGNDLSPNYMAFVSDDGGSTYKDLSPEIINQTGLTSTVDIQYCKLLDDQTAYLCLENRELLYGVKNADTSSEFYTWTNKGTINGKGILGIIKYGSDILFAQAWDNIYKTSDNFLTSTNLNIDRSLFLPLYKSYFWLKRLVAVFGDELFIAINTGDLTPNPLYSVNLITLEVTKRSEAISNIAPIGAGVNNYWSYPLNENVIIQISLGATEVITGSPWGCYSTHSRDGGQTWSLGSKITDNKTVSITPGDVTFNGGFSIYNTDLGLSIQF